ncbi:MAG: serine/threonine protein kinase [Armatimonadetes bacterium]|nr:serine/threonine protein kinase [Armatimonadota bacterium]
MTRWLVALAAVWLFSLPASARDRIVFVTDPPGLDVYLTRPDSPEPEYLGRSGATLTLPEGLPPRVEVQFGYAGERLARVNIDRIRAARENRWPTLEEGAYRVELPFLVGVRHAVLVRYLWGEVIGLGLIVLGLAAFRAAARRRPPPEEPGTMGPYRLEELLGEGGMALVYRGVRPDGEPVAVKVLRSELCATEEARRRFAREIKASRRLRHKNLAPLYDWGEGPQGRLYLATELLEGQTLRERLSADPKPARDFVLKVIEAVGEALDYLHGAGVIHRDVKPANIFVCHSGQIKLVDLGIARGLELGSVTRTGVALGTPQYLAPEQARGAVSPANDQYSLAIVVFEMLAGRRPYEGVDDVELIFSHVNAPVPSLTEADPEASPRLDAVLRRMMAKSPEARFSGVREAVIALRDALQESGSEEDATRGTPIG